MTFIRPEIRRAFGRNFSHWSEVFTVVLFLCLGALSVRHGLRFESLTALGLGTLCLGLSAVSFFAFRQRARFQRDQSAPGFVEVDERRVGYLGPDTGAFVDLDDLTMLEIVTTDQGPFLPDVFWVLTHSAGPPLNIPTQAEGSGKLFDVFTALPGVDMEAAIIALGSTENARFLIWKRTAYQA